PVVSRVAEDVEQLLACFLVELGMRGNMLQHGDETGLRTRLVQRVGDAVIQGVKVLATLRGQHELLADQVQNVLFGLGSRQIGVEKMVAERLRSRLQIIDAEGAYGLDDIRSYGTKWCIHLRFTFLLI